MITIKVSLHNIGLLVYLLWISIFKQHFSFFDLLIMNYIFTTLSFVSTYVYTIEFTRDYKMSLRKRNISYYLNYFTPMNNITDLCAVVDF